MQIITGNKYVTWLLALTLIAVLQGIAISKDTDLPLHERPFLSISNDFAFSKKSDEQEKRLFLLSSMATMEDAVGANKGFDDAQLEQELSQAVDLLQIENGEMSPISTTQKELAAEDAEDIIDLEEMTQEQEVVATQTPQNSKRGTKTYITHEVKRGQNLAQIARMYRMPLPQLVFFNNITDPDHIYPGYKLRIDFDRAVTHKVKAGDSLWSIAKLYNVGVSEIRTHNELNSDSLSVGQKLKIDIKDLSEVNVQKILAALSRKSRFVKPVEGRYASKVGWRVHPITKKRHYHKGLDIAAPTGREIVAAESGKVSFSGRVRGYGNLVIIEHSRGYTTRYAHCSTLGVVKGQKIGQGEVIAKVGSTGLSTGPHCHFEIRRYNKVLKPTDFI